MGGAVHGHPQLQLPLFGPEGWKYVWEAHWGKFSSMQMTVHGIQRSWALYLHHVGFPVAAVNIFAAIIGAREEAWLGGVNFAFELFFSFCNIDMVLSSMRMETKIYCTQGVTAKDTSKLSIPEAVNPKGWISFCTDPHHLEGRARKSHNQQRLQMQEQQEAAFFNFWRKTFGSLCPRTKDTETESWDKAFIETYSQLTSLHGSPIDVNVWQNTSDKDCHQPKPTRLKTLREEAKKILGFI